MTDQETGREGNGPAADTAAHLDKLAQLHADGVLTADEFAAATARVLPQQPERGAPTPESMASRHDPSRPEREADGSQERRKMAQAQGQLEPPAYAVPSQADPSRFIWALLGVLLALALIGAVINPTASEDHARESAASDSDDSRGESMTSTSDDKPGESTAADNGDVPRGPDSSDEDSDTTDDEAADESVAAAVPDEDGHIRVPSVVGMERSAAFKKLGAAGFKYGVDYEDVADAKESSVKSVSPSPGSRVSPDTKLQLVVERPRYRPREKPRVSSPSSSEKKKEGRSRPPAREVCALLPELKMAVLARDETSVMYLTAYTLEAAERARDQETAATAKGILHYNGNWNYPKLAEIVSELAASC